MSTRDQHPEAQRERLEAAGWSRVYLGVHYPLDVLAGAGIGLAAGGVIVLAAGALLRRTGRAANGHDAATGVQAPRVGPEPQGGSKERPEPR